MFMRDCKKNVMPFGVLLSFIAPLCFGFNTKAREAKSCSMAKMAAPQKEVSPDPSQTEYLHFLEGVRLEALEKQLASRKVIDQALCFAKQKGLQKKTIIAHDRNQPEFQWSWQVYRKHIVSPARVALGKKEWTEQKALFATIKKKYGIDPRIVLGIWGIESHFGEVKGKYNVFAALSTLSFDGRRSDFFRKELLAALQIAGKKGISPEHMTSGYAGAMGQAQFMPSAYLHYATTGHEPDFFHGRHPDIWNRKKDALFSIANYIKQSGWKKNMTWGEPVKVSLVEGKPKPFAGTENFSSAPRHTLSEWENLGVYPLDGGHFTAPNRIGILFQPSGNGGESFMLYPNFKVVMRYNPSEFYALAACLLGDLSARAK